MTWIVSSAYSALESIGYRPRELYTFTRGSNVWRMTGGTSVIDAIFSRPGLSYQPGVIARDRIERSDESRAASVTVRVARTTPVADALREVRASPMLLHIERWQDKDAGHPAPVRVAFGPIANVRLVGGWVEFEVLNDLTGDSVFDLPFPSRLISRQNQWPTYSEFTAVNEDDFSFETTITAITRSTITVAATAPDTEDGDYDSGMIRVGGIGDHGEPMYVRYSQGLDFFVNGRVLSGLDVGDTVTLVLGDDKSLTTARDKFGAQAVRRFLGFDLLPTTDPLQTGVANAMIFRSPYTESGAPPTTPSGTPTPSLPAGLSVHQAVVETPTDVTVKLTIDDPDGILTLVEARYDNVGFAVDWVGWNTVPIVDNQSTLTYPKGLLDAVRVQYRITYGGSTPGVQTTDNTYHGGWHDVQVWVENNPSAGLVGFDFSAIPGQAEVRAYLTMTQDDILSADVTGFDPGDSLKLAVDARGGPFFLTFPPKSYIDGVLVTGPVFWNAVHYLRMTVTYMPAFDWVHIGTT